ncbi:MAG: DUF1961 family protein [Pedobacter sp.]|nr:DUF1961 family protein [Chitinophagaceae bacterium]
MKRLLMLALLANNLQAYGQLPFYSYLKSFSLKDTNSVKLTGPARIISVDGRKGINLTSIHSVLELKVHNLKQQKGTVTIWVMPLEELSTFDNKPNFTKSNPNYNVYPFLSDCSNPLDFDKANFKLAWITRWHPSMIAQFGKGSFYEEAFNLPHKALISVSHFAFKKDKWYQLALSWNYKTDEYALFVNGIQVGREDQNRVLPMLRDTINTSLFLGNPTLCFSEINFYNDVFSKNTAAAHYKAEVVKPDAKLDKELAYTYAGVGRKKFNWKMDASWQQKMAISMTKPTDIDSFYVQGNPVKVAITKEGLLVETINKEYTGRLLDSQVYVWSNRPFEGNLYVEYEFKTLRPGGLSLLMVQASGMDREDFMADYPLRTGGRMTTVYGEDVRNYHWEYYREMSDMRNDLENSALMKNPFLYPLSFGSLGTPVNHDVWHKLQFLQVGNKLVGAIDGTIMVEFTDDGFSNNGPVYDFGRIAIRCMLHSKLLFRNLKVYNQSKFKTEQLINIPTQK